MRVIAGRWKGHRLSAPPGRSARPTTDRVREAWMAAAGPDLAGARVLDLFAGTGALGLEALSRGATEAVFVERARGPLKALRQNIEALGAGDLTRVVPDDVFRFLRRLGAGSVDAESSDPARPPYDVAFADPPYDTPHAAALVELFLERPFASTLWLEHPWRSDLPLPPRARTRRYGDTALTTLTLQDHDDAPSPEEAP